MSDQQTDNSTFPVSPSILNEAVTCPWDHNCTTAGECETGKALCPTVEDVAHNVLFVEDVEYEDCPYRMCVGPLRVCRCPVRYALYKQHGV